MKQKHLAALLREDITTVAVYFSGDVARRQGFETVTRYNYLVLREDAKLLAPGNMVVVPANDNSIKVAQIAEVHDEPDIDPDAEYDYKFVIDKVDTARYDAIMAHHIQMQATIQSVEKTVKRRSILDTYRSALAGSPDLAAQFDTLRGGPALPAPAAAPAAPSADK